MSSHELLSKLIPLVLNIWGEEHRKAILTDPERLNEFLQSDLSLVFRNI